MQKRDSVHPYEYNVLLAMRIQQEQIHEYMRINCPE